MDFEWDEKKNKKNFEKHGIKFTEAVEIFKNFHFSKIDTRKRYGEQRTISIGTLENIVIVVVHTRRKQNTRVISARKANKKERRQFYEYFKKETGQDQKNLR